MTMESEFLMVGSNKKNTTRFHTLFYAAKNCLCTCHVYDHLSKQSYSALKSNKIIVGTVNQR
jgi:hypothetical protein